MKKIILLSLLLLFIQPMYAQDLNTQTDLMQEEQQEQVKKSDIKLGGGISNRKGYITLKVKNKQVLKLSTKQFGNELLRFVNIGI